MLNFFLKLQKQLAFCKSLFFDEKKNNENYCHIINIAKKSQESLLLKENEIFKLRSNELQWKKSLFSLKQSIKIQSGYPHSEIKGRNLESLTQGLDGLSKSSISNFRKTEKNTEFNLKVQDISRTISQNFEENKDESDEDSFEKLREENQKLKKLLHEMTVDYINQKVEIGFTVKNLIIFLFHLFQGGWNAKIAS